MDEVGCHYQRKIATVKSNRAVISNDELSVLGRRVKAGATNQPSSQTIAKANEVSTFESAS